MLARRIATLDVLSGGRVLLGVGVGWSTDEFEAAGTPWERRGARSDEILQAMIEIWKPDPVSFDGSFYRIPESSIGPKPIQQPHPPVYIAGFGQYAFDRAAKFGDGWNPSGIPNWEWLEMMIGQLQQTAERAGRANMEVVLRTFTALFDEPEESARAPMMGTLDQLRDDLKRLRDIGVTHLIHSPASVGFSLSPDIGPGMRLMEQLSDLGR
jgi:probable F420-dependent oxidoreductase